MLFFNTLRYCGFKENKMNAASSILDLDSLRLKLHAEFDEWQDFVNAVDEFQKKTSIKLTITTSRKMKSNESPRKKPKFLGFGLKEPKQENNDVEEVSEREDKKESKAFEYQYLKLTCKHYGGYKSTSRGIRPNQRTAKLMCPTYIYGCFDHCKQKFVIKQMTVNCNHELKDEEVLLSKVLKDPIDVVSNSSEGEDRAKKRYVKVKNRNVLKIPLESPNVSNYLPGPAVKIRCNHELNESCDANTLTVEDLHSIHELFHSKSKKEQNQLMMEWIQALPFENSDSALQVLFSLPAFDGSLVKVCFKAFSQVLRVSANHINGLIYDHYDENGNLAELCVKPNTNSDPREIENCIANILTSFSKEGEGEGHQIIYCDTVDVPYTVDTIEETLVEENISNILESQVSIKNESQVIPIEAQSQSESSTFSLKPPIIKLTPAENGFALEVNCDYKVNLKAVNIENGKTLKLCFNAKE